MADQKNSSTPDAVSSNRGQMLGSGVGQEELDMQEARGREVAESQPVGDLGVGTPPGVDVHNLGQPDKPQEEWGEPAGEAATFSSNNTRKGLRIEAEQGQGAKTRRANKDIVSRRT